MMISITLLTTIGSTMVSHLGCYVGLYCLYEGDTATVFVLHGVMPSITAVPALILLSSFSTSEKRAQEIRIEQEERRGKL